MKILQVTLGYYPAVAWGGPVMVVAQNSMELIRRGHQVVVYCTNLLDKKHKIQPGTFERTIDGLRVVYFDTWRLPWWPGTLGPVWLPHLQRYLQQEVTYFDIVHLNGYRNLMLLPVARAARHAGVPFVVQPHGALPVVINTLLVKRLYDRLIGDSELQGLGALIASQETEREQALTHGIPTDRIIIVPNGIDCKMLRRDDESMSFRKKWGISDDCRMILFLGRINRKKGVDMLVEAFARVRIHDAFLVIAGPDDGQLAEVRGLVDRHGLAGRVIFTGLLEGPEVSRAYSAANLFVLPCRTDTFPLTIIEACMAGTPMVITDRCEISGLVRDRVADVTPFEPEAFSKAMESILLDKDKQSRYRKNGPLLASREFSVVKVVDRLETIYQQLIAQASLVR